MTSIEKTHLEFTFALHNVQFNRLGDYYLRLAVQNSFTREYGRLGARQDDLSWKQDYEMKTEVVAQTEANVSHNWHQRSYSYFLPKGFCKNDNKNDVFLLIEAYEARSKGGGDRRVGEAKYAIYPRTNAPKANLHAELGHDMYKASDFMTLLRTLSTENLQMHCGRLKFTASLKKVPKPPKELGGVPTPSPEPISLAPTPRDPTPPPTFPTEIPPTPDQEEVVNDVLLPVPTTSDPKSDFTPEWGDPGGHLAIRTKSPDIIEDATIGKKIQESPISTKKDLKTKGTPQSHVSPPDTDEVSILLHAAHNLPTLPDGCAPIPYCVCKTKKMEDLKMNAKAVSRATDQATQRPVWSDTLLLQIDHDKHDDEVLVLTVADKKSKTVIANYRLPLNHLEPFHQYHVEMILPDKRAPSGVKLFASITRKKSILPRHMSSPNYTALEVLLNGVQQQLSNPVGPLVAVGRIIHDVIAYQLDEERPRTAYTIEHGIKFIPVHFPSPVAAAFKLSNYPSKGHPQVTQPGIPPEQPEWNQTFLFSNARDKATLFTPGAALLIELFEDSVYLSDAPWSQKKPVAHAVLVLDQSAYKQLTTESAVHGLTVDGLPMRGTDLKSVDKETPTLGCVVRLITSERPDSLLAHLGENQPLMKMTEADGLMNGSKADEDFDRSNPWWNWNDVRVSTPSTGRGSADGRESGLRYALQRKLKPNILPIQDGELPPFDAMENILPEYQYIFTDPESKGAAPGKRITENARRELGLAPNVRTHTLYSIVTPEDLERSQLSLLDHQMRELEKYRTAVHKMGQDILTLQDTIRDVEGENSKLRRDLARYNDSTRLLMDSQELDGLTKPELAARYVALKQKLTSQTSEMKNYKDELQRLQNRLISKNDSDKEVARISYAHESQNELLQHLQSKAKKAKKLEEAVKKQEQVIERMETLLKKTDNSPSKDKQQDKLKQVLAEENKKLRNEIADLRDVARQNTASSGRESADKLEMFEKLDKADTRIRSLEKQLSENARQWAREKSDLLVKLQEAEHGFWRSAPLHFDYINPKVGPSAPPRNHREISQDPRRYSKAPPKNRQSSTKLDPIFTSR